MTSLYGYIHITDLNASKCCDHIKYDSKQDLTNQSTFHVKVQLSLNCISTTAYISVL